VGNALPLHGYTTQMETLYNDLSLESEKTTYIFPLLQSQNLKDKARNITDEAARLLIVQLD
jgi:hypothetical protein